MRPNARVLEVKSEQGRALSWSAPLLETWFSNLMAMSFKKESSVGDLDRITQSPDMMSGRPCIRGMRITVSMIVGQIGAGVTIDELLTDYSYLEREDIMQALLYAAWRSDEREVLLLASARGF
jgi:uncharacterized protein (DUF433 family)